MDNDMFLVYCAAAVGVSLVVHKLMPIALVSLLKIFPDGGNSKLEVLWGDIGERKEATEKYKNDVDKIQYIVFTLTGMLVVAYTYVHYS